MNENDDRPRFRVSSFAELHSLLMVMVLAIAGIAWGLKLEFTQTQLRDDIEKHLQDRERKDATTEAALSRLPVIDLRINHLELRMSHIEDDIDESAKNARKRQKSDSTDSEKVPSSRAIKDWETARIRIVGDHQIPPLEYSKPIDHTKTRP